MDPRDVLDRPAEPPDAVLRYGEHADALVDVHLPAGLSEQGPRPVVVLLHGGFWRPELDRTHTRPLAQALAAHGFVVATPEYRRIGNPDGWPATFDDVEAACAVIPRGLESLGIATATRTLLGHSAGGQLALWLATRGQPFDRVVALAPVADLGFAAEHRLGEDAVRALLGGEPDQVPDRYSACDPAVLFATPPTCEVVIVHGTEDAQVPVASSRGFAATHGFVDYRELAGVEHFALIDPLSPAWPLVLAAVAGD